MVYKYIYSLNDEILILYKIVAYSCDWVANTYNHDSSEEESTEEDYIQPSNDYLKTSLIFGLIIIIYYKLKKSYK